MPLEAAMPELSQDMETLADQAYAAVVPETFEGDPYAAHFFGHCYEPSLAYVYVETLS